MKGTDWLNCQMPKNMSKTQMREIFASRGLSIAGAVSKQKMIDDLTDLMINELRSYNGQIRIQLEQRHKMENERAATDHSLVETALRAELERIKQQKDESDHIRVQLEQQRKIDDEALAKHLVVENGLKKELEQLKIQLEQQRMIVIHELISLSDLPAKTSDDPTLDLKLSGASSRRFSQDFELVDDV